MQGLSEAQRDAVMADLKAKNIDSRPVFYPIHKMDFYQNGDFCRMIPSGSNLVSQEGISLPTYIGLDQSDISFIAETLKESLCNQRQ
jgi:perosamine synthetase